MFTRNFGRAIVGSWSDISSTSSIRAPSPVSPLVPPPSRIDLSQRSIAPGNLDPSSKYLPDPLRYTRFLEIPFFFSLSFFFFLFFFSSMSLRVEKLKAPVWRETVFSIGASITRPVRMYLIVFYSRSRFNVESRNEANVFVEMIRK